MKNKEIIAHVINFGIKNFETIEIAYAGSDDETSASRNADFPGTNWRVSTRASIIGDEVFFGINTIGGGHGYNTHLFTDTVTPELLDRYLEKAVKDIRQSING